MTANLTLYAATLAALGGALSYTAGTNRRESVGLVLFFELSFWLRAAAVFANARFGVLPQKFAACFPLDMINQQGGIWSFLWNSGAHGHKAVGQVKFFLEALANLPGIFFFENSHKTLNLTNCLVGALAGLIAFAYMRRLFDRNTAVFAMVLASFYPAALNFSIFGLRDIFLYLFILVNIASLAWLMLKPGRQIVQLAVYCVSLASIAVLRSAFLPFILVLPLFLLAWALTRRLARIRDGRKRAFLTGVAVVTAGLILVANYAIVLHHVGLDAFARPDRLLNDYVEARAARGTPFAKAYNTGHGAVSGCVSMTRTAQNAARGVASQYIPFGTYMRTPWVAREMVQIVGFVVIPLPWQFDRWSRALALIDSVFVAATVYAAWRAVGLVEPPAALRRRREDALRALNMGLLLSFLLGWLGYGLLVTDAGNAFRLRLTVEPFLLFGTSLYLSTLPWLRDRTGRVLDTLAAAGRRVRRRRE
jgi:hypothetical protein